MNGASRRILGLPSQISPILGHASPLNSSEWRLVLLSDGRGPDLRQISEDFSLTYTEAQHEVLAVDPRRTPDWILDRHPANPFPNLRLRSRPPRDFHVQKRRNAIRCQRITVEGLIGTNAWVRPRHFLSPKARIARSQGEGAAIWPRRSTVS